MPPWRELRSTRTAPLLLRRLLEWLLCGLLPRADTCYLAHLLQNLVRTVRHSQHFIPSEEPPVVEVQ